MPFVPEIGDILEEQLQEDVKVNGSLPHEFIVLCSERLLTRKHDPAFPSRELLVDFPQRLPQFSEGAISMPYTVRLDCRR